MFWYGCGRILTWIVKWTTHGAACFEQISVPYDPYVTTLWPGNQIYVVNYPFVMRFTQRANFGAKQSKQDRGSMWKSLIHEFVFYLYRKRDRLDLVGFSHERERILNIICETWKGQIFLCDWILPRGIGDLQNYVTYSLCKDVSYFLASRVKQGNRRRLHAGYVTYSTPKN